MTRLIVFDCDGTLVDSQHIIVAAAERAFVACGQAPPAPADVHAIIGLSLELAVKVLQPDAAPALHDRLVDEYRVAWRALRADGISEPLYPDARMVLEELDRRGHLLAVATGKSRPGLLQVLEHHRLTHLFVSLQTADRHPSKPHPAHARGGDARRPAAAPEETLMVGDTSYDMTMAQAAGARAIGVAWGYHPVEALASAGAVDDPRAFRRAARAGAAGGPVKRFYTTVEVAAADAGHRVLLDGRPLRTPARHALALPSAALAEALAEEWRAQGETLAPHAMPLTRLASTAQDRMPASARPRSRRSRATPIPISCATARRTRSTSPCASSTAGSRCSTGRQRPSASGSR